MKVCSKCNKEKPEDEYYDRGGKRKGELASCCKQCQRDYTVLRSKGLKARVLKAINQASCEICGYDKYNGSPEFHHRDPKKKDFQLSKAGSRSWKAIMFEVAKCAVLCSNCHREVHAGVSEV